MKSKNLKVQKCHLPSRYDQIPKPKNHKLKAGRAPSAISKSSKLSLANYQTTQTRFGNLTSQSYYPLDSNPYQSSFSFDNRNSGQNADSILRLPEHLSHSSQHSLLEFKRTAVKKSLCKFKNPLQKLCELYPDRK